MTRLLLTTSLFAMMAYAAEAGGAAGDVTETDDITDDGKTVKLGLTQGDLVNVKELLADLPNWTKEDVLHIAYRDAKENNYDVHTALQQGVAGFKEAIQNDYAGDVEAFRADQKNEPRPDFTITAHTAEDNIGALVAMLSSMDFDDDDYAEDADDFY